MKYSLKRTFTALAAAVLLLTGCSSPAAKESAAQSTTLPSPAMLYFPASDAGKTEYNSDIYAVEPFTVTLILPDGWSATERDVSADSTGKPLSLASVFSIYDIFNADGTLVGAIGYNLYEPYESDADSVAVVYSQVRMGSGYRFDTDESYTVVREFDTGKTATVNVLSQLAEDGQSAASAPESVNRGILSYDHDKLVFVALEFDAETTTAEQVQSIAESLQIS